MDSHLVTVKVSIKRSTYKRMKLDSLTLYKYRLKCLNTESMKCRRSVKHYRMLFDDFLKDIPYIILHSLNHLLGRFYIMSCSLFYKFLHYERLEKFYSHLLWKTALIDFKLRSYYDNRSSRIVNTLSEKVLTETSLLTL